MGRAAEGLRLPSPAALVSIGFVCDIQWHRAVALDIQSYVCMHTLCCLDAIEVMWLYVCIKFVVIPSVIKPVPPSKSICRELYSSYTFGDEKAWVQIKCIISSCHRTGAIGYFLSHFIRLQDTGVMDTFFPCFHVTLQCNKSHFLLGPLGATII